MIHLQNSVLNIICKQSEKNILFAFMLPHLLPYLPNFLCQFVCSLLVGKTEKIYLKALTDLNFILLVSVLLLCFTKSQNLRFKEWTENFKIASFLPPLQSISKNPKTPKNWLKELRKKFILASLSPSLQSISLKSPAGYLDVCLLTKAFFCHSSRRLDIEDVIYPDNIAQN